MELPWFSLFETRSRESLKDKNVAELLGLLRPKCKQIHVESELATLLKQKKKLRIKLGVDPTGAELHLGHAMPLMLLRLFQRAGHEIHLVIGDFTAQIGDPSGRTDKRKEMTRGEILRNMKTYAKQAGRIIDVRAARVHQNSKWLGKMPLMKFLSGTAVVSFGEIVQREDFRQRIKSGVGVSLQEANYSTLMAMDSLELKANIEVGGIDQLLNFMQTREIMGASGQVPETILMTPILEGTAGDGRKMSKSFNNYLALDAPPNDQFGLIMSIPDKLMLTYFISFADIYENEIGDLDRYCVKNPLEAKKELGMLIVSLLHGNAAAKKAREEFERKFSKKEYSAGDEITVLISPDTTLLDALSAAFGASLSKSKIRTLIRQGAVKKINQKDQITLKEDDRVQSGDLIKAGKMNLFRFKKK